MSENQQQKEEESISSEVFDEIKTESTGLVKGLVDEVFGDFLKFLSILTTTAYWFYRPLSINSKDHQDPSSRFMNDLQLAKSLFFLLIIFLVIGGTAESDSTDVWIHQAMFLVVFSFFLIVFIVMGKIWCVFARPTIDDNRQFSANLLYQGCTLIFIQGILFGFFDLTILETVDNPTTLENASNTTGLNYDNQEFNTLALITVFLIPYFHTLYFFHKLSQAYSVKQKKLGMIYVIVVIAVFLFFVSIVNEVFLSEDSPDYEEISKFTPSSIGNH
ncbi:hypothetical protein [Glaciecola petra]|uniref:Uncharacterized protein n=1 Tax=Glaciecola petra TaxID=3075602 RepID=A0ABU2ZLQ2_9ALTE|nr:hypothetical protein [Aestuariibacter sp. P117]MDT0593331.1 hypothetical protein [Aestuariibacter sp. P117]